MSLRAGAVINFRFQMPGFTKWQEPYFVNKVGNFLHKLNFSLPEQFQF